MAERTSHDSGLFSWTDLATSDHGGAKSFYSGLFGWDITDQPLPEGGVYSMATIGGRAVAAVYPAGDGQHTAWAAYVTVDDVDAAATRAAELGATTLMEPFDVLDVGRMAVVQDPTDAVLCLWQAHTSIGAELVNVHGALTLTQLNTNDPERAQGFYGALFGWRFESVAGGENPYWGVYLGDRLNAGMMELQPDAPWPSHWLVYFGVDDIDAAAARIEELGGRVAVPATEVPAGRFLVGQDPQGAFFGLFAGEFDD